MAGPRRGQPRGSPGLTSEASERRPRPSPGRPRRSTAGLDGSEVRIPGPVRHWAWPGPRPPAAAARRGPRPTVGPPGPVEYVERRRTESESVLRHSAAHAGADSGSGRDHHHRPAARHCGGRDPPMMPPSWGHPTSRAGRAAGGPGQPTFGPAAWVHPGGPVIET
eukprot:680372-Hanusia_phi.AAC.1